MKALVSSFVIGLAMAHLIVFLFAREVWPFCYYPMFSTIKPAVRRSLGFGWFDGNAEVILYQTQHRFLGNKVHQRYLRSGEPLNASELSAIARRIQSIHEQSPGATPLGALKRLRLYAFQWDLKSKKVAPPDEIELMHELFSSH